MVEHGNWTEDRREALKGLTGAEIDAGILRLQAENPGRALPPDELAAKLARRREALTRSNACRTETQTAETVGA